MVQRDVKLLPFSRLPRAITAKWWIGFTTVNGCSHFGIASTGLKAPDNVANGGFTKKLVNNACCADLLKVAMTVPMLIPERIQSAPPPNTSSKLP